MVGKNISPCGYNIAIIYLALGEKDTAIRWLEKAYRDRSDWLPWAGVNADSIPGEVTRASPISCAA